MAITLKEYQDYLTENKSLVLATVDKENLPQIRHLGGYNIDGKDIVFLTTDGTGKTKDIAKNPRVAVLFQHEGQQAPKNITVYGTAERLEGQAAVDAAGLIKARRPQLQYNPPVSVIYRVKAETIKVLDFASEEKQLLIKADTLQ